MIGRNLKIILYDKKISQKQLATAVGVAQKTISNIATGKTKKPQPDLLYRMSKYLGVEMSDFFKETAE